ncbi:hypothetical protein [Tolypothrix sp. NIES-4075]|nr:hypothetical protein [Tolypothrix sp. NIES-4075]
MELLSNVACFCGLGKLQPVVNIVNLSTNDEMLKFSLLSIIKVARALLTI